MVIGCPLFWTEKILRFKMRQKKNYCFSHCQSLQYMYVCCSGILSTSSVGHQNNARARILVQVTIYRRLLIGRDGHLDQSEAYDIS